MRTETHIQSSGPICRHDGCTEWEFHVVYWEYKGRKQEAERIILDAWRVIEHKNGTKERVDLNLERK